MDRLVFDPATGRLLSIMDGVHITTTRTAAASAVATRALARSEASELALVGAGVQARSHLEAMLAVRPIRNVRVTSRNRRTAERFVEWSQAAHPAVMAVPTDDVQQAVEGADIVCTVSTATEPVLAHAWLKAGCHVNGVGSHTPTAREIDGETMRLARVAVDSRAAALGECGDCMIPLEQGLFDAAHVSDEIGEILLGAKQGRSSDAQITVYQSNGTAAQDVVTAKLVYDRAAESGVGTETDFG